MPEYNYHVLDIKLAGIFAVCKQKLDISQFDSYVKKQIRITQLKDNVQDLSEKIELVKEAVEVEVFRDPEKIEETRHVFGNRMELLKSKQMEKNKEIDKLRSDDLKKEFGPLVKKLEEVLKSCGVERQAYHSRSFIGNHVHKMLAVENIAHLCNVIPKTIALDFGLANEEIHREAIEIAHKFKLLFSKYAKCHHAMNSSEKFDEQRLNAFKENVADFMAFFRKTWPAQKVTPKLHMLEHHVAEFIERWGVGMGVYGEQGGESIHAEFNSLGRTYSHMPGTKRLESVIREHYTRNNILAKKIKPEIKRRKLDN